MDPFSDKYIDVSPVAILNAILYLRILVVIRTMLFSHRSYSLSPLFSDQGILASAYINLSFFFSFCSRVCQPMYNFFFLFGGSVTFASEE